MTDKKASIPQVKKWIVERNVPKCVQKKYFEAHTTNSRKSAIRSTCVMCCGGQVKEVSLCTADWCPLYRYRIEG